ncbi:MAG: ROK family protein [Verrucomicrobia bacterium]|jgi:glucokinase|nr:ROK family protein [Verrucomicrobiota bacterium]OQC62526.1 MAG: Glucokinase [Verrucomicrobia bacterium ADurb.Bin006]MDI9380660.1 ROK family protein [Verrucomicrobiota bacterium]NMD22297.1 ROK family protein [Verrucomicrobiota bacterium]HOA59742.1 ROK family protein [Verrucomicrobiota bacterium]
MSAEREKETAIGIDIGGTKMALGIVDGSGIVRVQAVLPTEAEAGFDRAVTRLGDAIEALCGEAGARTRALAGIGIGCAGPLDTGRGLINNPYTLAGWDKCDIVTPLRARFGVRVRLENDADAAAMGECFAGAGRGFDPIVMLTLGTGVGGAAIVGGEVYRGANGEHPELGHVIVSDDGPPCYCGCRGCLESLASGSAIGAFGQTEGLADARAVFAAARNGKTGAQAIVDRALAAAAAGAWTVFHTFLPRRLILGGGIAEEHFDLFAAAMNGRLRKATQFTAQAVEIVRAQLGNAAGMIGAAALVLR